MSGKVERWSCGKCRVSHIVVADLQDAPHAETARCEVPGCKVRYACGRMPADKGPIKMYVATETVAGQPTYTE
jgi:hypothetical protein